MNKRFRGYTVRANDNHFRLILLLCFLYAVGVLFGSVAARRDSDLLNMYFNSAFGAREKAGLTGCILSSISCNLPVVALCFIGSITVFGFVVSVASVAVKGTLCGYITAVMYSSGLFGFYFSAVLLPLLLSSLLLIVFSVSVTNSSLRLTRLSVGKGRAEYDLPSVMRIFLAVALLSVICCVIDGLFSWMFYLIF